MVINKKNIREEIGKNLKELREKKNFTQVELAKKAGISANYYAKIERGTVSTAPEKIYKIIKALDVDASDIFPS